MTRAWDPATNPALPTSNGTAGAVQRPDNLRLRPAGAAALAGSLPSPAPQTAPEGGPAERYMVPALSAAAAARARTARIRAAGQDPAAQEPAAQSGPRRWPEAVARAPASALSQPDELPLAEPVPAPEPAEPATTPGLSVAQAAQVSTIAFRPLHRTSSAPEAPPPSAPEAPAPRAPLFPPISVFRPASEPAAARPALASAPQPAPERASQPAPERAPQPALERAPQPAPERARRQQRFAKTLADLERSREAADAQILREPIEPPPSLWSRLWSRRKNSAPG